MPKWLEVDEFYLTVFPSSDSTSAASAASRRIMAGRPFQDPLRAAVRHSPRAVSKSATDPSRHQPLTFRKKPVNFGGPSSL